MEQHAVPTKRRGKSLQNEVGYCPDHGAVRIKAEAKRKAPDVLASSVQVRPWEGQLKKTRVMWWACCGIPGWVG